jgi:hypothetical protein
VRFTILVLLIILVLFFLLSLSGFFTIYDPVPSYYYETATSVAGTNSFVDTAIAATQTAKVK